MYKRQDRVIASPIAGTTRDAIDTNFVDSEGQEYTMIDTAGMRKSGKVYENTEKYSIKMCIRDSDNPVTILNQKDLLESANLKQTSLYTLGQKLSSNPVEVTQYYIEKGGPNV